MNQKISTKLGVVIILIVAVTAGAFVWKWEEVQKMEKGEIKNVVMAPKAIGNNQKQKSDTKDGDSISIEKQTLSNIDFSKLTSESLVRGIYVSIFNSSININPTIEQNNCVNWKRDDGIFFGFSGWKTTAIRRNSSTISDDIDVVKGFLESHGFIKNNTNTRNLMDSTMPIPGNTFGYERGNLKCIIEWSELSNATKEDYFQVSCAQYTSQNENTFNEFSVLLNETNYLCVLNNNGTFSSGISGGSWYAKKINGKWNNIWEGQGDPPCSKVRDFPKNYYEKCLN